MASATSTSFLPYAHPQFDGTTVTPIANVPSRVGVSRYELVKGAHFTVAGSEDNYRYCVLSGTGWAEWPGQERIQLQEGNAVFVLDGDRVTIGTDDVLVLLQIYADLLMPQT